MHSTENMRCRYFVRLAGAGSKAGLWTDIPARFGGADRLADAGSGKAKQTVIVVGDSGGADKLVVTGSGGMQQTEIILDSLKALTGLHFTEPCHGVGAAGVQL